MTIIVWDGKTLASDSQSTTVGVISSVTSKKIFVSTPSDAWGIFNEEVLAFAVSGNSGSEIEFADKLRQGLEYDTIFTKTSDFYIFVITKHNAYGVTKNKDTDNVLIFPIDDKCSTGCAWVMAVPLLYMGMGSEKIVEIVCNLDIYCGGEIQTFTR